MEKTKILLADDHTMFRQGLRQILETQEDLEVVGEAKDGKEAVERALALLPDVVLMDINMPVMDGVAATRRLSELNPNIKTVILTMYRQDKYVFEAIKAGAFGYLLKDADSADVMRAIRSVREGEALIDPAIAIRLLDEFRKPLPEARSERLSELTERDVDILRLVSRGDTNQEIAGKLCLSEKTVRNRLSAIFQKLHINNRTEAALYALKQGLAFLDSNEG